MRALEELARRWKVPKSEALRRVIRAASAKASSEHPDAISALEELQESLGLNAATARRWERAARAERREYSKRLEGK